MHVQHGRLACRECFNVAGVDEKRIGLWRIQNDPCYWGGSDPEVLVLGFSKGFTQARAVRESTFENIPFKGMRDRLTDALRAVGLLSSNEHVNQLVSNPQSRVAFASLIRCSVARVNEKASFRAGKEVLECSGPLIKRSFKEIPEVISNCSRQFLADLPKSVRTVALLGVDGQYVKQCQLLIKELFPSPSRQINEMSLIADDRLWIWISHPSGSNGHFSDWLNGVGGSGQKQAQAKAAVSS